MVPSLQSADVYFDFVCYYVCMFWLFICVKVLWEGSMQYLQEINIVSSCQTSVSSFIDISFQF